MQKLTKFILFDTLVAYRKQETKINKCMFAYAFKLATLT